MTNTEHKIKFMKSKEVNKITIARLKKIISEMQDGLNAYDFIIDLQCIVNMINKNS